MDTTPAPNDLDAIRARLLNATDGPWAIWPDLRPEGLITIGDATGVIPEGADWTDGPSNTVAHVYTEEDAEFIRHAPEDVRALLDELAALKATCTCATTYATYEGPEADCPVHGAVRAFNEAVRERDAAREELAKTRAELDELHAESRRLGDQANHLVQQVDAACMARQRIADAHHKHVDAHGGTWGECNECGNAWPCPTYVWATTNRDPLATWDPADDDPVQPLAEVNPATTAEPADEPKATACNGNCIYHLGEVVVEDLCCPLHGVEAEPAAG